MWREARPRPAASRETSAVMFENLAGPSDVPPLSPLCFKCKQGMKTSRSLSLLNVHQKLTGESLL